MPRKIIKLPVLIISLLFLGIVAFLIFRQRNGGGNLPKLNSDVPLVVNLDEETIPTSGVDIPQVSVVAEGLDTPWAIAILPEGGMLVTERKGTVRLIDSKGKLQESPVADLDRVKEIGEGGLQGIALHPDFTKATSDRPDFAGNHFVYLYYTYSGDDNATLNRVVRMEYQNGKLTNEKIIVDGIPGAGNHDGGRIKFGPDKFLYITTGDAQNPSQAQDKNSLAGKILRVTQNGDPVVGNPFGNRIFSYGHRNPQGIDWDKNGGLWETEHGPSGLETGNDEFNKIEIGKNYGWPEIRGMQTKAGMVIPILESGRADTWAPGDLAFLQNSFYFTGLRGASLYQVKNYDTDPQLLIHFKNEFGRLREVVAGPDGMLYVSTSNRDGRGIPKSGDDKILRINPGKL